MGLRLVVFITIRRLNLYEAKTDTKMLASRPKLWPPDRGLDQISDLKTGTRVCS